MSMLVTSQSEIFQGNIFVSEKRWCTEVAPLTGKCWDRQKFPWEGVLRCTLLSYQSQTLRERKKFYHFPLSHLRPQVDTLQALVSAVASGYTTRPQDRAGLYLLHGSGGSIPTRGLSPPGAEPPPAPSCTHWPCWGTQWYPCKNVLKVA